MVDLVARRTNVPFETVFREWPLSAVYAYAYTIAEVASKLAIPVFRVG